MWSQLQHGEQRVALLGQFHLVLLAGSLGGNSVLFVFLVQFEFGAFSLSHLFVGLGAVGLGSISSSIVVAQQTLVELAQRRGDFVAVVCLPEFKVGTTLEQFADTLRLTDTRHFDHDAAFLSFQFLDVGLYHTKLVDTVAHHVVRVVDGRLYLFSECLLHLAVRALCAHLAFELLCGEHRGEGLAGSVLVIILDEERDEITLTCLFLFLGLFH